jgi:hypothetical protein
MNTPAPTPHPARRQFLLLLAIFLIPIATAYLLFFVFPKYVPKSTTNYGQLVRPARPLPALKLIDADGRPIDAAKLFKGKWSAIFVGAANCAETCSQQLFLMRQVRIALDKDQTRYQRIYIAPDTAALAAAHTLLASDHKDLLMVADAGDPGGRASDFFVPAAPDGWYLTDPLGNWLMVYPPHPDHDGQLKDFSGILKDLKHLLMLSQVD